MHSRRVDPDGDRGASFQRHRLARRHVRIDARLPAVDLGDEVEARRRAEKDLHLDRRLLSPAVGHDLDILGPEEDDHRRRLAGRAGDGEGLAEADQAVADRQLQGIAAADEGRAERRIRPVVERERVRDLLDPTLPSPTFPRSGYKSVCPISRI